MSFTTSWSLLKLMSIAAAAAKLLQSCLTLCDPSDSSPPGSPIPGILQARIVEWVAISFSNACMHAKLLQSCLTLCDPMDSSPPGSSVHKILGKNTGVGCQFLLSMSIEYHPTISPSVTPFSSCPQSFPASGSFQMSQLFTSGDQSIGSSASASVLPMNVQG